MPVVEGVRLSVVENDVPAAEVGVGGVPVQHLEGFRVGAFGTTWVESSCQGKVFWNR